LSSLVEWLAQHRINQEPYIDYEAGTVNDAWGYEIVLVTQDEELLGFGSAGPNHVWEKGRGDDIVVKLADVE